MTDSASQNPIARELAAITPGHAQLPPGFIAIRKGGRPKREARDAAVFLARHWRVTVHQESAAKAEKWIVDEWERLGTAASKGIGEPAHVRGAIKRARTNGLNSSLLMIDHVSGLCSAVECRKTGAGLFVLEEGLRSWHWAPGLTEALQGRVENPTLVKNPPLPQKTLLAEAIESMLR